MATTIQASKVSQLLRPFSTGDSSKVTPISTAKKSPGVAKVTTVFSSVDQRGDINIAKYARKKTALVTPFMMEDLSQGQMMLRYAIRAVNDSIGRSEAPLASHAFYYSLLNYNNPIERDIGLHSQMSWIVVADLIAIYIDFGITPAMEAAINVAQAKSRKIEYRSIGGVA